MAPVESDNNNTKPLLIYSAQLLALAGLTAHLLSVTLRAARTLPPSADTRAQIVRRKRHVITLAVLSGVSLIVAGYFALGRRVVSYNLWANAKEQDIPGAIWEGWYGTRGREGSQPAFLLGSWYADSNVSAEGLSAVVGKATGFWWLAQQVVGTLVWSVFVGIEARRRNIPKAPVASLIALSLFVSLSYAQNLFYILLLYTPVPMGGSFGSGSNPLWAPHPATFIVPLGFSFVQFDMAPYLIGSGFTSAVIKAEYFLVPAFLAFAPYIVPIRWGTSKRDSASAHRSYTSVFYWASVMSFVLYWKHGITALRAAAEPETVTEQYSLLWNKYVHGEERSVFEKSTTALTRLLNAISAHPAIGAVGWDVLLSALSLCLWTLMHSLDVDEILRCAAIPGLSQTSSVDETPHSDKHVAFKSDADLNSSSLPPSPTRSTTSTTSKRGRPKKNTTAAASKATTNGTTTGKSTRRRKTAKAAPAADHDYSDHHDDDAASEVIDAKSVTASELDGPSRTERAEAVVEDAEATALAWGLYVLGGLGAVSAGVLGAEVRSR